MATTSFDAAVPSREDETMMPPPSPKLEDHDQAVMPVFCAEISNANVVVSGLRGILGKKNQHALVEIAADGLMFTCTEQSKACQGCAFVASKLFDTFDLSPQIQDADEAVLFRLNLSTLLHCLGSLSSSSHAQTSLKLAYFDEQECFSLQLTERSLTTECKIRTMEEGDSDDTRIDFAAAFRDSPTVNRAILPSEQLREALVELSELPQASTISLLMSPEYPFFRLKAHGEVGSCEVIFPLGDESFTQFECKETLEFGYRQSLMQIASKALQFADKTCVRVNESGMLSMQHMICQESGSKTYVDFFVLADNDTAAEAPVAPNGANGRAGRRQGRRRDVQSSSSDSE